MPYIVSPFILHYFPFSLTAWLTKWSEITEEVLINCNVYTYYQEFIYCEFLLLCHANGQMHVNTIAIVSFVKIATSTMSLVCMDSSQLW